MHSLYLRIYEKQAAFYKKRPRLIALLRILNAITLVLVALAYAWLCLYALIFTSPRFQRIDLWKVLGIPALCLSAVSFLRAFVKRARPYENGIEPLLAKNGTRNSFPSRHTASAFVIGGVACAYLPVLGVAVFLLGTLISYLRFAAGLHYPSDLAAGAVLGILCSLLAV